jgi:16S rRNA (guanine527-N7)-methyltransferase
MTYWVNVSRETSLVPAPAGCGYHWEVCRLPLGGFQPRIGLVLPRPALRRLLEPFSLALDDSQEVVLLTYLELLLRWNSRINLIGPATAEECITRHFAESLYLTRHADLHGKLLDIGSGAGFPGLALKIAKQDLRITLLEPVAKKRAFLKEIVRACHMNSVEVLGYRVESYAKSHGIPSFDVVTARAVGRARELAKYSSMLMKPQGLICLWLGQGQAAELIPSASEFAWRDPVPIPLSKCREILMGRLNVSVEG